MGYYGGGGSARKREARRRYSSFSGAAAAFSLGSCFAEGGWAENAAGGSLLAVRRLASRNWRSSEMHGVLKRNFEVFPVLVV